MTVLSQEESERYARHLVLPEVGTAGQLRLRQAKVLCLGAGGLGSPVALYLAAAGVGTIGIVDSDRVESSNLQRQVLHRNADLGRAKTDSARERLQEANPNVEVRTFPVRLTRLNALEIIKDFDIVVDGSDNFPTRFLANDASFKLRKPCVSGAIYRFEGQATVLAPHLGGPCYRCLFPESPPPGAAPNCLEAGVLGVLPGIIGCIQAAETIKLILERGSPLLGRLLLLDALDMKFREIKVRRDPQCALCGERPTIVDLIEYQTQCNTSPNHMIQANSAEEVTVQEMKRALEDANLGITVIDVREPDEHQQSHVPGTRLMPMSTINQWLPELDADGAYYVHCRSGGRSLQVTRIMKSKGFNQVKSVRGGIMAWAEQIAPAVSNR